MNAYKPLSLSKEIHNQNTKNLLKIKRPIASFKKSWKPQASLKTQIRRKNTAILQQQETKPMRDLRKLHETSLDIAYGCLRILYEEIKSPTKVIGQTITKNYNVDEYKNPPKKAIIGWRRKKIIDKDGKEHIVNLAVVKDPKTGKTKTIRTSVWHKKPS